MGLSFGEGVLSSAPVLIKCFVPGHSSFGLGSGSPRSKRLLGLLRSRLLDVQASFSWIEILVCVRLRVVASGHSAT